MDKYDQKWVADTFKKTEWAITIGQTSYFSVPEDQVSAAWHRHEDEHKKQWARDGKVKFLAKYLYYQAKYGYANNPYEIEAMKAAATEPS